MSGPDPRSKRRPARRPRTVERPGATFWGREAPGQGRPDGAEPEGGGAEPATPPSLETVRLTGDPSALVRSLGEPPLGRNPAAALHHLSVVYEEAVKAATALAAANDLLDMDDEP